MTIECVCGNWHALTPTALAVVIKAYQEGDMQTVATDGVQSVCMENAFSNDRIAETQKRYPGRAITFEKGGV